MSTARFKRRKVWLVTIGWGQIIVLTIISLMTILYAAHWLLAHWWTYGLCVLGSALLMIRFRSFEPGHRPIFRDYVFPFIPITRRVAAIVDWNGASATEFGPDLITVIVEKRSGLAPYLLPCNEPQETVEWLRDNIFTPSASDVAKTETRCSSDD